MFRRRRPLARAAMVGGAAYYAGKRSQERSEREADQEYRLEELEAQQQQGGYSQGAYPPPAAAPSTMSPEAIAQLQQLAQLKDQGVLTQEEFDTQKRRLLGTA